MTEAVVGLHVESLTPPSVPGHSISGVLIDSVLGNFTLTAVRDLTRMEVTQVLKGPGPMCKDRSMARVRGPGEMSEAQAIQARGLTIPETIPAIGAMAGALLQVVHRVQLARFLLARSLMGLIRISSGVLLHLAI